MGSGQTQKDKEPGPEQALAVPVMAPGWRGRGQAAWCPGAYILAGEGRLSQGTEEGGWKKEAGSLDAWLPPKHKSPFQDVPLFPTQILGHLPLL